MNRKLIDHFPDFNSFYPHFVTNENLKKNCYKILEQIFNHNSKEAGKWKNDPEKLKSKIYEYCYNNLNKY